MRGGGGKESERTRMRRQLIGIGVTDEAQIAAALEEIEPDDVYLWPWQEPAYVALQAAETQWRWIPMTTPAGAGTARRTGIDYGAARVGWRMAGIRLSAHEFNDLRVMEMAMLNGGGDGD
jgi:hypothetical protein